MERAIVRGNVFGAERIRRTNACSFEGLFDQSTKIFWLSQVNQSAESAITIRSGSVD